MLDCVLLHRVRSQSKVQLRFAKESAEPFKTISVKPHYLPLIAERFLTLSDFGISRKLELLSLMPWPSPSVQDLNKRLSLPADIRIPDGYLEKLQISSPPFDQPMSRRSRRASLVSF